MAQRLTVAELIPSNAASLRPEPALPFASAMILKIHALSCCSSMVTLPRDVKSPQSVLESTTND